MLVATVLVAVAVIVLVAVVGDDGKSGGGAPKTAVVRVDGVDGDSRPDDTIRVPEAAVQRVEAVGKGDLSDDLSSGDSPTQENVPLATQEFPGCRTQFVRNQSTRTATPRLIVWHYTVSADRPGFVDNDALTAMANNPANGVSWHFSIGRSDGNCAYNVPLTQKAWTQGNANSFSVGIEVIALGSEGEYVTGAGRARLLQVTREIGRRLNIPMQRGAVSNCVPTRSGIIRHIDLGACGGGHHDTTPMLGYEGLLSELAGPAKAAITAQDRVDCRKVKRYAAAANPSGAWTRAVRKRQARVHAHGLFCKGGVVKRRGD